MPARVQLAGKTKNSFVQHFEYLKKKATSVNKYIFPMEHRQRQSSLNNLANSLLSLAVYCC